MEVLFALVGKDFVITAADNTAARSIVIQKRGEDKSCELTNHALLLYNGEPGDTGQFSEYITRNIRLYGIKNGIEMTPSAAASFTRRELATSLRSRSPYQVNLMIAGVDIKTGKPELYWLDHLASVNKLNYAAHGYASYFVMSTMDMYWHPDLTLEEGKELIKKCIHELKTRFMGNLPDFIVKVVSKDGIQLTKV